MITRCPECGTKFRISVDLIRADDSSVRCGDCMTVFDARAQLVDEASESTYLADSARERAARLRYEQQASLKRSMTPSGSTDASASAATGNYNDGHGEEWLDQERGNDQPQRNSVSEQTSDKHPPRGQLFIDRRESETDLDLENAETIAFQPLNQFADESPEPQDRAGHRSPEVELAELNQPGANTAQQHSAERYTTGQHSKGHYTKEQYTAGQGPATATPEELNPEGHHASEASALDDYSRRIDPLINPDEKAIEFERTLALEGLALEGLTGIESDYPERQQSVRQRSVLEKSIETASPQAETTARAGGYGGEHRFDPPARVTGLSKDPESIVPQTQGRNRVDFKNDPDIVNRPMDPPRSERHLSGAHRSSYHQPDAVGYDRSAESKGPGESNRSGEYDRGYKHGYAAGDDQSEHFSLDSPRGSQYRSESATSMREHLSEHRVAIDTDDEVEYLPQARSGKRGWALLALLVAGCAAAFYARDDIAKSNLPQQVRAMFCSVAGCELPVASNISDLELLRQKVFSHSSIEGALVVSIDVVNNAVFPQPYPVLSITMANSLGESVAQRNFIPEDYLESYSGTETLAAGKPTRINIDIIDPGADAESFEMEFRQQ